MRNLGVVVMLLCCGQSVHAQIGVATELTQILNKLQLISIESYQIKQWADMLKQAGLLKGLPATQIDKDIQALQKTLIFASNIVAQIAAADARFRQRFPGYNRLNGTLASPYAMNFEQQMKLALDASQAAMRAAYQQDQQIRSQIRVMDDLRSKADGSQGRNEILSATAALSAEMPKQLLSLRSEMENHYQEIRTYNALQAQYIADQRDAADRFFQSQQIPDTGNGAKLVP